MKSSKLLSIQKCHFNLPDSFNGTLGDALMLLAQYRLQCESEQRINNINTNSSCYRKLFDDDTIKCAIKYSLCKLSGDKSKWESI